MVFGESLAKPEAKDEFAVGKVGDDLASIPFGCWRPQRELLLRQSISQLAEFGGRGFDDFDRVAAGEEFCVRIEFHTK